MTQFDPEIHYTAAELAEFIVSGTLTGADIPAYARSMQDNIEAEVHIRRDALRRELFDDMRKHPCNYPDLRPFIKGVANPWDGEDIYHRFIRSRQTISFDELKREGLIFAGCTEDKILDPFYYCPSLKADKIRYLTSQGATEVIPLGMDCTGKTSMLAGLLYDMVKNRDAEYKRPDTEDFDVNDTSNVWFERMVASIDCNQYPCRCIGDSFNFAQLEHAACSDLRFIAAGVWNDDTIDANGYNYHLHKLLIRPSKKILLFVIDYGVIAEDQVHVEDSLDQALFLDNILSYLTHNGMGKGGNKGCTFSTVRAAAVVITKFDKVERDSYDEKDLLSSEILQGDYLNFYNNLCSACRKFGIETPQCFTWSQPSQYIGKLYLYDNSSARLINDFLIDKAARRSYFISWLTNKFKHSYKYINKKQ